MIVLYSFTDKGKSLCQRIKSLLVEEAAQKEENVVQYYKSCGTVASYMQKGNLLIFVGAAGIAVRSIAPYIQDKSIDPAVLVIDEQGRYVIPILSGHLGGGNLWADKLASYLDAAPVITTATDGRQLFAIDSFAAAHRLRIVQTDRIKGVSAGLLQEKRMYVWADAKMQPLMQQLLYEAGERSCGKADTLEQADILLLDGEKDILSDSPACVLFPQDLLVGMGCKKGKSAEELYAFLEECFDHHGLSLFRIRGIYSVQQKREEEGLIMLAQKLGVPFCTYTAKELMHVDNVPNPSAFVEQTVGIDNVCERSALYAGGRLLLEKQKKNGMTLAVSIDFPC